MTDLLKELEAVALLQDDRLKAAGVEAIARARVLAESAALRFVITHHAEIADMAKRLEAADALLREAVEWNWLEDGWPAEMEALDERITAHLSENGHE